MVCYALWGALIGLLIPVLAYVQAAMFGGIGDLTVWLWPGGILTMGLHEHTPRWVSVLVVAVAVASNVILYALIGLGLGWLRRGFPTSQG